MWLEVVLLDFIIWLGSEFVDSDMVVFKEVAILGKELVLVSLLVKLSLRFL